MVDWFIFRMCGHTGFEENFHPALFAQIQPG